jgi:rare lipoprotein A
MKGRTLFAAVACAIVMSACSVREPRDTPSPATPVPPVTSPPRTTGPTPRDIQSIPDAVPKPEPRSKRGNPAFYDVLGKRYFVLSTAEGFVERGVASWYGPGFHNALTSMGERYDMYAMSAAHKTVPLPAYARVTNLQNGRSVVVRINDRGPFVANRIIDLSYTAAAKLDLLRSGTGLVEVRVLTAGKADPLTRASESPPPVLYVQAGAFSDAANAKRLADKVRAVGIGNVLLLSPASGGGKLHRVRIGPIANVAEFDRIAKRLNGIGVAEVSLASD